jgi:hypothetical protein
MNYLFYSKIFWGVNEVTTWNQVKDKPAETRMRRVALHLGCRLQFSFVFSCATVYGNFKYEAVSRTFYKINRNVAH